ncbi:MAG TPA: hypothetical protein VGP93_06140, partial [Polyangiaceae bacterium]|nr:hypothetical protein [Polyangiaceae bacterium]
MAESFIPWTGAAAVCAALALACGPASRDPEVEAGSAGASAGNSNSSGGAAGGSVGGATTGGAGSAG